MTRGPTPRRAFAGFLLGMLLMQAGWILAMPAFRGIDEFDHVYKAASVARGQWTAPDPAPAGRGGIVTIPGSIVHAASSVCRSYSYTGHDNCFPIRKVGNGEVEVATAAGSYNPAYYVVVGSLARPFSGAGADFAMRTVTALMCAVLVAWAAAVIARWATTSWPLLTLAAGLTPVLVYSTSIAAPNGLTYSSAALIWAALIGLARVRTDEGTSFLVVPLAVGSAVLITTHATGAMWLLLSVIAVALLRPVRDWLRQLNQNRLAWAVATTFVLGVTALCVAWVRLAHTNNLSTDPAEDGPFPFKDLPLFQTLWALQSIAVFPLRDERAPAPVYVIWGAVLSAVVLLFFRLSNRRERLAGVLVLGLLAVVPTILTMMSFRTESFAWQGRYSLPLWLGLTSLAGLTLDRRREEPSQRVVSILFVLLAVAMTTSTVHVGLREISHGPSDPIVANVPGGMVLVGVLTALGALMPLVAFVARPATAEDRADADQHLPVGT